MKKIDLDRAVEPVTITLAPGTAWLLYVDDGPGGPCGQSMRTTGPHAELHVWPDEETMRKECVNVGRNQKCQRFYGVVGEWTGGGVFQVSSHS